MNEPAVWFVCVLGVSVVFIGLLFLVGIIMIMNLMCSGFKNKKGIIKSTETIVPTVKLVSGQDQKIENRQEILAAVCAAVAEENNTDISAIRVISFKKV